MRLSSRKISLFFISLVVVEGCHSGYKRKKRQTPTSELEKSEELRIFFENCLTQIHGDTSWQTSVDFSVLDSNWYYTTATTTCENNDTVACWKEALTDSFLNADSPVSSYASDCIDAYFHNSTQSNRRKRQVSSQISAPRCVSGSWTNFYDLDNPNIRGGDIEPLVILRIRHPESVCSSPSAIEVRDVATNQDYRVFEQRVDASANYGFRCDNALQPNKICLDYKVRYCCPQTATPPPTQPPPPTCDDAWTPFFDRDDPSGRGDYEALINLLQENPGRICRKPSAIEVRDVATNRSYQNSGQIVKASLTSGFRCINNQQRNGVKCKDYKIRFCCPKYSLPICGKGKTWTKFYDRDDADGTGDYEPLQTLRNDNPGEICSTPSSIDVRDVKTNLLYQYFEQEVRVFSTAGFSCRNNQQSNGRCRDYKVRFCCPNNFNFSNPQLSAYANCLAKFQVRQPSSPNIYPISHVQRAPINYTALFEFVALDTQCPRPVIEQTCYRIVNETTVYPFPCERPRNRILNETTVYPFPCERPRIPRPPDIFSSKKFDVRRLAECLTHITRSDTSLGRAVRRCGKC